MKMCEENLTVLYIKPDPICYIFLLKVASPLQAGFVNFWSVTIIFFNLTRLSYRLNLKKNISSLQLDILFLIGLLVSIVVIIIIGKRGSRKRGIEDEQSIEV